jgi:hypothetical protein
VRCQARAARHGDRVRDDARAAQALDDVGDRRSAVGELQRVNRPAASDLGIGHRVRIS